MNAPEPRAVVAADRTKFIGGSDAAAVLGINPWRTPLELWRDKTQAMPENLDPDRRRVLERGKRMEPYVIDLLVAETGLEVIRRNERYIDSGHAFLAAEIDAECIVPGDGAVEIAPGNFRTGLVQNIEIKTVSPFKAKEWGELGSDQIPVHYTAQAQHGLMVTGRFVCVFGVLIGGDDFRIYRVERDDEIIEAMRAREVAFWRDHVETLTPPAPTSAADIEALFQRDAGTAVEATPEVMAALDRIRAAKEAEKAAEAAKELIQLHMRDAARLTFQGRDVATWKTQSARRFDQRAFQAAHGDLFEQFIKTQESRVFRLK